MSETFAIHRRSLPGSGTGRLALSAMRESLGGGVPDDPNHVARIVNIHTVSATPDDWWVTDGETRPAEGRRGDTLLAHIRWSRPNLPVGDE